MVRIATVTIHHPGLGTESEVPATTVPGWARKGWIKGPLPARKPSGATPNVDRHTGGSETSPVGENPHDPKEGQS